MTYSDILVAVGALSASCVLWTGAVYAAGSVYRRAMAEIARDNSALRTDSSRRDV